jgi:chaperonin GroES
MDVKPIALDKLVSLPNIATELDDAELAQIAAYVADGYQTDDRSRDEWEARNAEAMKLALQVQEDKTEPWVGCSNVKFPLITVAAMHYHARAYPALVDNDNLVKCMTFGKDADGTKQQRADRIAEHMTWQNMEQMSDWEPEHDRVLLVQPILGVAVKKRFFDPVIGRQRSEMIPISHFVVNYYTKGDVNEAPRATHVMEVSKNWVRERVVRGVYLDYDERDSEKGSEDPTRENDNSLGLNRQPTVTPTTVATDQRTGVQAPLQDDTAPVTMLEQACWLDLDGDDYAEPYFVTVELETQRVRRIVARFVKDDVTKVRGEVAHIKPEKCYVKYGFIPAPDGSWYDIGLGHLLGPINHSVDTALNQMFDAGTMSTVGGGFLGRGARLRAGDQKFKPYEWKTVDSIGDDLRKNIVSLDVKEPSRVLLELMTFLVQYGERVASANDVQVGENVGQNTPAETMRTMNANGARIFSGIYKRTWRSMRDEYRIQYDLNRTYFTADRDYGVLSRDMVTIQDYLGSNAFIKPAADPSYVSDEQRQQIDDYVLKLALTVPGFNRHRSIRRALQGRKVSAIDVVFPPLPQGEEDLPSPPDPKMLAVQVKQGELTLRQQAQQMEARNFVLKLQQDAQLIGAQILELRARAIMELAQAKGVDQGHQIALIDAMIGAKKAHYDALTGTIDSMTKLIGSTTNGNGADTGPGSSPAADGSGSGQSGSGLAVAPDNAGVFTRPEGTAPQANGGMGQG